MHLAGSTDALTLTATITAAATAAAMRRGSSRTIPDPDPDPTEADPGHWNATTPQTRAVCRAPRQSWRPPERTRRSVEKTVRSAGRSTTRRRSSVSRHRIEGFHSRPAILSTATMPSPPGRPTPCQPVVVRHGEPSATRIPRPATLLQREDTPTPPAATGPDPDRGRCRQTKHPRRPTIRFSSPYPPMPSFHLASTSAVHRDLGSSPASRRTRAAAAQESVLPSSSSRRSSVADMFLRVDEASRRTPGLVIADSSEMSQVSRTSVVPASSVGSNS